jgi:hypothetical protein
MIGFVTALLTYCVLSRFGLSIPVLFAEGGTAKRAVFRADELAEGNAGVLLVLVVESVVGSYIAFMLPYWSANAFLAGKVVPNWFPSLLRVVGFIGALHVQPIMFIGMSMLYLKNRAPRPGAATSIGDVSVLTLDTVSAAKGRAVLSTETVTMSRR